MVRCLLSIHNAREVPGSTNIVGLLMYNGYRCLVASYNSIMGGGAW